MPYVGRAAIHCYRCGMTATACGKRNEFTLAAGISYDSFQANSSWAFTYATVPPTTYYPGFAAPARLTPVMPDALSVHLKYSAFLCMPLRCLLGCNANAPFATRWREHLLAPPVCATFLRAGSAPAGSLSPHARWHAASPTAPGAYLRLPRTYHTCRRRLLKLAVAGHS